MINKLRNNRGKESNITYFVLNSAFIISILAQILWLIYYIYVCDIYISVFTFLCLACQVLAFFLNRRERPESALFVAIVSLLFYKITFSIIGRYVVGNEYAILILIVMPFMLHEMKPIKKIILTIFSASTFLFINYYHKNDAAFDLAHASRINHVSALRFCVIAFFFCMWAYIQNIVFLKSQKSTIEDDDTNTKDTLVNELARIKGEHKKHLSDLIFSIPGGIFQFQIIKTGETKFIFISDGCAHIWGITKAEVYADFRSAFASIHPDDKKEYLETLSSSNIEHKSLIQTFRILGANGKIKWILSNSYPQYLPDGSIIRTGSIIDITEQKEKELQLNDTINKYEKEFFKLLDLIPQGIFIRSLNGYLIWANKSFCEIIGSHRDELINKKFDEFKFKKFNLNSSDIEKMDKALFECDNTYIINDDIELVNKNGDRYYFDLFKTMMKFSFSEERLLLGFLFDTTKFKENLQLKDKLIEQATLRNKTLEEFSFMVSHNIRAQVTNILVLAERLNGDMPQNRLAMYLDFLSKSVYKLDEILRDLNEVLNVKKIEDAKVNKVDFESMIDCIVNDMKMYYEIDEVVVLKNIPSDLEFHSVNTYINSIFHNLISNSFKYRKPEEALVIDIIITSSNEYINLNYADNGIGFDAIKNKGNIFGMYRRFNSSTPGKGLGLYLVKNHVLALGGTISVQSEIGKGTSFSITLKNSLIDGE